MGRLKSAWRALFGPPPPAVMAYGPPYFPKSSALYLHYVETVTIFKGSGKGTRWMTISCIDSEGNDFELTVFGVKNDWPEFKTNNLKMDF
jgi:hypothetical protein